ncbi:unnamed protein product, partial [Mesorhabditis spiculigera]
MPLAKRKVQPEFVCRETIPKNAQGSELRYRASGTLCNLIRQLASLSKNAEDVFGEIYHESMRLEHKATGLQQRMERLATRIDDLVEEGEQPKLEELQIKPFKSSCLIDQHSFERTTLPTALEEFYTKCDPPPNLNEFNRFRGDVAPALSLYSNPSFFFDLWRQEMLKDCVEVRRRAKSPSNSPRKKKNKQRPMDADAEARQLERQHQRQQQRHLASLRPAPVGVLSFPEEYQAPQALGLQLGHSQSARDQPLPPPPAHLVAPVGMSMPPPMASISQPHHEVVHGRTPPRQLPPPDLTMLNIDDDEDDLPPPPPVAAMHASIVQQLPTPPDDHMKMVPTQEAQLPVAAPAPPPPPPPPPPPGLLAGQTSFTVVKREATDGASTSQPKPVTDTRSNLLLEIQSGITLKKVRNQQAEEEARAAQESNDVAAILRRRMESIMGKGGEDSQSDDSDDASWDA